MERSNRNEKRDKPDTENGFDFAHEIKKLSPVTLMLPFDVIRMENLIRPKRIGKKRLETTVDEILLPVFAG